jgi:hypothetical protein
LHESMTLCQFNCVTHFAHFNAKYIAHLVIH